jgi:hypothetical protein
MTGRLPEPLEELLVPVRWDLAMFLDKRINLIQYALDVLSDAGID